MAYAKRTDSNQQEIINALRSIGASVQDLSKVGCGVPDILVGYRGQNHLVEIKADKNKLTDRQVRWHNEWHGNVLVIRSLHQALDIINR